MIRLLVSVGVRLLANALGLVIAASVLDKMTLNGAAFVIAVLIFTVVEVLVEPLLTQVALTKATALRGSVALLTTFVGLLITDWLSAGLSITGAETWILATIIVWLATMIGMLLLPLLITKRVVENRRSES